MSELVDGAALLIELAEALGIAGERALCGAVFDAGAEKLKRCVDEDDGGSVVGEQFAVGALEKSSAAECEHCGIRQGGENLVKLMMLNGTEAALSNFGKQLMNLAVDARDLLIEIYKRTLKPIGEQAAERALACSHETDENQERGWRFIGH